MPFFAVHKLAAEFLVLLAVTVDVVCLRMLRRGLERAAAALFFSVTWCILAGVSLFRGGTSGSDHLIAGSIVLSLGAGWRLGRSSALGLAAASLILSFSEALLQKSGHPLAHYFRAPPIIFWSTSFGLVVLSVGPLVSIMETHRRHVSALRDSEDRFQSLSNLSLDGIVIHHRGTILDANLAFTRLFGYERPEDLIGRFGPKLLLTPESRARIRQPLDSTKTFFIEITGVRKDGTTFEAELEGKLIKYRGRNASLIACRDITNRKQVENAKAKFQAQLYHSQKMESIGRLAGGVAHDFNNLLTVINGYSQLVLLETKAGDPVHGFVSEIARAGERASGLTRQLLAFSRKQIMQPRSLELSRLVREMRPMLQILAGANVELCLDLSDRRDTVHADPHQLEQVIMNLAANARDAMPAGGKLSIRTGWVERNGGSYVRLSVTDEGTGMDEATRRLIFEPFFTTKDTGKGTGLGLSMVQGIVAQSGGYIEVKSEPGLGTTIDIYLPALTDAAAEAQAPAADPMRGGQETILVVDDQPEILNYVSRALKIYGYDVIEATSCADALLLFERDLTKIQLILTDAVMPNMSGWELAVRLEKIRPGVKVLFMSGFTGAIIPQDAVLTDGIHFIQKPFSSEALALKVRAMLSPRAGAA